MVRGERRRGARPRSSSSLIAGGHSNLTFGVTDADGNRYVLRRPPLGHVLATAHDMGREHRIISALGPTDVPVAPALGLCTDDDGQRRAVLRHGLRRRPRRCATSAPPRPSSTRRAGAGPASRSSTCWPRSTPSTSTPSASATSASTRATSPGSSSGGTASSRRRTSSTGRPVPLVHELHDRFARRIPEQQGVAIVHGDYRLDNCMVGDDGNVVAVLDWEICTLGDPLADVGLLLVYWTDADDAEGAAARRADHSPPGFPTKAELIERYAATARTATCRSSTSTSPSGTGSWPASSRASTAATPAAPWATPPASRASPPRSTALARAGGRHRRPRRVADGRGG